METNFKAIIDYTNLDRRAAGDNCNFYPCGFYETIMVYDNPADENDGDERFIEYSFEEALALVMKGTHVFSQESIARMSGRLSSASMSREEAEEAERIFRAHQKSGL